MAAPPMSPQETAFLQQFKVTIDLVAAGLADLHQQMNAVNYRALRNAEDAIIAPIKTMVGFTQDIESNLHALSQQTLEFLHYNLPAPVVILENEPIPLLLTVAERGWFDGTLASVGYRASAGYALADPQQAMRSVGNPLGRFLASRSAQAAAAATPSNVTVSNNAHGWTIVYTPIYITSENGLGSPSTPVSGYLNPGRYRFGIKQTSPAQWDSTSWSIPAPSTIHVPLP
jgi:hypothetical protein